MERKEQERIVEEMCTGFKHTLMVNVGRVPENWDGIELRRYFADKAAELYAVTMDRTRFKAYQNDVIVENL